MAAFVTLYTFGAETETKTKFGRSLFPLTEIGKILEFQPQEKYHYNEKFNGGETYVR